MRISRSVDFQQADAFEHRSRRVHSISSCAAILQSVPNPEKSHGDGSRRAARRGLNDPRTTNVHAGPRASSRGVLYGAPRGTSADHVVLHIGSHVVGHRARCVDDITIDYVIVEPARAAQTSPGISCLAGWLYRSLAAPSLALDKVRTLHATSEAPTPSIAV